MIYTLIYGGIYAQCEAVLKKFASCIVIVSARNCVKSVRYQTCFHTLSRLVYILIITWLQS